MDGKSVSIVIPSAIAVAPSRKGGGPVTSPPRDPGGRGQRADWFRNILENSQVQVQIGDDHFAGVAEPIMDPARIADFLDYRLRRHPIMIRLMLSAEGLPLRFNRAVLEKFARGKALVVIHRQENKVRSV